MSDLWSQVLSCLENKIAVEDIEQWLKPAQFLGIDRNFIKVLVPESIFIDWIQENYLDEINHSLGELGYSSEYTVQLLSFQEIAPKTMATAPAIKKSQPAPQDVRLNPRYTFDHFVVGKNNQFAHAAAKSVGNSPCSSYNPLFLYGSSGLGKTHLLHAIGHEILQRHSHLRVCYTTCEEFTNQFINSIRYNKGQSFRQRYRNIDVLLIDDIQFLSGKTQTQEEFFHTFNALHSQQSQIILTSDCEPIKIPKIEERVTSRFQWGLIADINPPALETRIAILRKKAEQERIELPDNVLLYIANKIKSNIRELEGALNKLIAYSSLNHRPITIDLAAQCLKNVIKEEFSGISCDKIKKFVADQFKISIKDLCSRNNSKRIAQPRQIAMYLTRHLTGMSLPDIGSEFGNKHHSTVLYSIQKVEKNMDADPQLFNMVETFEKTLR